MQLMCAVHHESQEDIVRRTMSIGEFSATGVTQMRFTET
jgi:hypothetical protein